MPVEFGLAVENFTPASTRPSGERILAYAGAAESLGFRSLWVWDHLFLGTRRPFPFLEAMTTLAALATRTSTATLGTGVLVPCDYALDQIERVAAEVLPALRPAGEQAREPA